jgi:hypothetical protein
MKLAVALIAFDRHEYFKQVVESLENQTDQDFDTYLFSDGHRNKFSNKVMAKTSDIKKVREIFANSKLPNKNTIHRDHNVGNGINQFEAVEYLSDNYENFLMVEDDAVLSPDYIRLCKIVKQPEDVFSFNLGFIRSCNKDDIDENINKLIYGGGHWFAEYWTSANWKQVRRDFLTYYQFIQSVEYQKRPHRLIKKMFASQGFNIPQTSQDAGKDYALFRNNYHRLTAIVNRGFYIGETGLHFRPETYKKYGFDKMTPYIHKSDKIRKKFVIK